MKNLQEKIEKMLQGEQKRKGIAVNFLDALTAQISDVCMHLWGESGAHHAESPSVWIWKMKDGKKVYMDIYFRYGTHYGTHDTERCGFYFSLSYPYWGDSISIQKGKDFWWAVRVIVEWLPLLAEEIREKDSSRELLCEKLNQFTS